MRDGQAGDRHRVVGEDDRGGDVAAGQERTRGARAGGGGEVGGLDEIARQVELGHRRAPDREAMRSVQEVLAARDVGDPLVAERGQVADGGRDARAVVLRDRRERARDVRAVERDGLQAELLHERDPRVVRPQVGQEDAVDALGAREVAVAVGLAVGVDDLQQQRLPACRELGLDAGDEGHEERVRAEHQRVTRDHQAERVLALAAERAGAGARLPAQLPCDAQDPLACLLGHAGPVVERERDRGGRHAGMARDVDDRRPPPALARSSHDCGLFPDRRA